MQRACCMRKRSLVGTSTRMALPRDARVLALVFVLVFALSSAFPSAASASPAPVSGELRFPQGATMGGVVDVTAGLGLLDLSPVASANGTVLEWGAAAGWRMEKRYT